MEDFDVSVLVRSCVPGRVTVRDISLPRRIPRDPSFRVSGEFQNDLVAHEEFSYR